MSTRESRNLLESFFDDTHELEAMEATCRRMKEEEEERKKAAEQGHTTI